MTLSSLPTMVLTSVALFVGIYGMKIGKPLTSLLVLGLWFQGVIAPQMLDPDFIWLESYSEKAAWTFVIGTALFAFASWNATLFFPNLVDPKTLTQKWALNKRYQRIGAIFTALAWVAFMFCVTLSGGVLKLWSRSAVQVDMKGIGFLDFFTNFVLLYPIILLQVFIDLRRESPVKIPRQIIVIPIILLVISFFLGTTTRTFLNLSALSYPFLMTMKGKSIKYIVRTLVLVGFVGFLCIGFLRFGRFLGETLLIQGGDVNYALNNGLRNDISINNSFSEYQTFSYAVQGVDEGGPTLGLGSYELAILQFVPGIMWAGKEDFISRNRPDYFLRDNYSRLPAALPSTFLGEGYLSGGMLGLITAAIVLGFFVGLLEKKLKNGSALSLGTTFGCLVTPALLIQVRMDFSSGMLFLVSGLVWLLIVRFFVIGKTDLTRRF